MRRNVTDVPWLVCGPVRVCLLDITMRSAKTAEPIEMAFGGLDSGGPKEPRIRRRPGSPGEWVI